MEDFTHPDQLAVQTFDDQFLAVWPHLYCGNRADVVDGLIVGNDATLFPGLAAGLEHTIDDDEHHLDRDLGLCVDVKPGAVADEGGAVLPDLFLISGNVHLDAVGGERRRSDEDKTQGGNDWVCD